MNVFFVFNNKVVTPSLELGTILDGVTRDSAITMLKELGLNVEERRINIDELIEAYDTGKLIEVFGTGTAATITMIKELRYKDYTMQFDVTKWNIAPEVKRRLTDIRESRTEDIYGWMFKV